MRTVRHNRVSGSMAGLLMAGLLMAGSPSRAADTTTANVVVPIIVKNFQATCDLSFTDNGLGANGYYLGTLVKGETREHQPFKAIITCQGADVGGNEPVKTALVASSRVGAVTDGRIRMLVDGQLNDKGPELWLETNGKTVPLDGVTPFCEGTSLARNECSLTPHTRVGLDAVAGEVSAIIVFDISYV
ncbi:hypothetical protein G6D95_002538 [Salmonella enterica]|uniref:Fimbrial protein n=1 Tax=Salmonella enterica subsp. salamae TaxID=59202 RepID=A0A5Y3V053_SALER|nr:hypothetical protein [Salmonella enterica subsp. salamae]ECJ2327126.1 hypothetical protein [Salmonella enterica subsp. salamae]EEO8344819.1 hypothetical protein [Salmonella enterica]HCL5280277.1 hypothetical protein [Salmonella enterica]